MKKFLGTLAFAIAMPMTMTACEVPEDGKTAADRAEVNKKGGKKSAGPKEDSGPAESVAQENARESAAQYLDTSAFSRTGLIKQLKFEGFSEKDAAYGVAAQNADWKKQAAASAENYLDMSSFSRDGLIQQLKFEGFTQVEAEYGASKNGF
jgi:hypothetical protein